MDEITRAIAKLLRGRTKVELELARGVIYSVLFPRRHPEIPLLFDLTNMYLRPRGGRTFIQVIVYAPVPVLIGGWED